MVILCSLTAVNAIDITNNTDVNSLTELNNENPTQTVSTYSASADSTSENDAVKTINKNDNSKSLKADSDKGTFEQLQKLIDDADKDSTIYLDKDYANSKNTFFITSVNVKKTITIDGQGHTLDANSKNRVFEISADNVVLRNMTLINGERSSFTHGNLIYWGGKDGLIENCVLKQSHLYGDSTRTYGGGIYANGDHLTVRNCEFNTLKGRYGSAIYLNSKNNVIDNCSFSYNYYYNERYTPPTEPHDIPKPVPAKYDNTIGGGAIYVDSSGNTIKNSYFTYNLAQEGGAIYINKRNNIVDSNIFYNNRASKNGGAIYVNAKFNNISNNIFYQNNIKENIHGIGTYNDIYSSVDMFADKNWWGNVNRDVCNPKDSTSMKDKNVKPTTFNDKVTVRTWYYLDVVDKSGKTIPNVITRIGDYAGNTFDFKLIFKLSRGIGNFKYPSLTNEFNLTGDKLRLLDDGIYKDTIIKGFKGDSLAFNMLTNEPKSTLKVENNMFRIDVPFTFKETYPLSRLQNIIDNVWENDTAYIYDDYKYDPSVDADMINGIIVNKTITIDGKGATIDLDYKTRGFYVDAPEVIIKNINIINGNIGNGGMGGAIFFDSKFGEIINATFESNTADYGGAVAITENYVTVTDSIFRNNYASEKGAGIYVVAKGLRITNNLFDSNHAAYGEDPCVEGYTYYISFSDNNTYINNSITGIGGKDDDDDNTPAYKPKHDKIKQFSIVNRKNFAKQIFHDKITVKSNGKEIPLSNNLLTLGVLNQIFNQNFTNGHLLVYIDGKLVFNSTTTDDLSQIIYKLIDLVTGNHEIRVEFTDKEGNTNSFTETINV